MRSPKLLAALGLLLALVLAAPAALAGLREGQKKAEAAIAARDGGSLGSAIEEIAAEGTVEAVKALLKLVPAARELDAAQALATGLAGMDDPKAKALIEKEAKSHKDWTTRYLLLEVLAARPKSEGHEGLFAGLDDKDPAIVALAMRLLAERKVKEVIPKLIDRLEKAEKKPDEEAKILAAAKKALRDISGEDLGDAVSFRDWWKAVHDTFDPEAVEAKKREAGEGAGTVLRRIAERGEGDYLEKLTDGDIFVVTGDFDHVEQVLEGLDLPHTVVDRKSLKDKVKDIAPTAVVIFNCSGGEEIDAATIKTVSDLVKQGLYVFTSDWELETVLMRVAPGFVGKGTEMAEHEWPIQLVEAARNHPYTRDVFPESPFEAAKMQWKIDDQSWCVKAASPEVLTLVACANMKAKYGSESVAVTFRSGKGSLLHVLSHFDKQKDPKSDGFALQQMLLNFIVEKQKAKAKKK